MDERPGTGWVTLNDRGTIPLQRDVVGGARMRRGAHLAEGASGTSTTTRELYIYIFPLHFPPAATRFSPVVTIVR